MRSNWKLQLLAGVVAVATAVPAMAGTKKTTTTTEQVETNTPPSTEPATSGVNDPTREAGEAISNTASKTGEAVGSATKATGQAVTDAWIETKLKEKFMADKLVDANTVHIHSTHHAVTLSGSVRSEAARKRALEIAHGTDGVESVSDRLSVPAQ